MTETLTGVMATVCNENVRIMTRSIFTVHSWLGGQAYGHDRSHSSARAGQGYGSFDAGRAPGLWPTGPLLTLMLPTPMLLVLLLLLLVCVCAVLQVFLTHRLAPECSTAQHVSGQSSSNGCEVEQQEQQSLYTLCVTLCNQKSVL